MRWLGRGKGAILGAQEGSFGEGDLPGLSHNQLLDQAGASGRLTAGTAYLSLCGNRLCGRDREGLFGLGGNEIGCHVT